MRWAPRSSSVRQIVLLALAFGLGWARRIPPVVAALLVVGRRVLRLAGLVRAELGPEQATAPRYVYIVAPSIIVAGAVLLARIRRPPGRSSVSRSSSSSSGR